jgi:hypothetical protein
MIAGVDREESARSPAARAAGDASMGCKYPKTEIEWPAKYAKGREMKVLSR